MWTFNKLHTNIFGYPKKKKKTISAIEEIKVIYFLKRKIRNWNFFFFLTGLVFMAIATTFYNTMGKIRKEFGRSGIIRKPAATDIGQRGRVNNNRSCGSTTFPRLKQSIRIPDGLASPIPSVHHLIQETFSFFFFFFKCLLAAFYLLDFFDWWYEIDKRIEERKMLLPAGSTTRLELYRNKKKKQKNKLKIYYFFSRQKSQQHTERRW